MAIGQDNVISASDVSTNSSADTIVQRNSNGFLLDMNGYGGARVCANASGGNCALWFSNAGNTASYWKIMTDSSHTTSAPKLSFQYYNANAAATNAGYVNSSGFNNSSSRAIKTNIANIKLDIDSIFDKLEPVQFTYIKDSGNTLQYGFIYEDLVKLIPTVCDKWSSDPEMRGINYSEMVPILVKEIQNLRKRVASLEEALENK